MLRLRSVASCLLVALLAACYLGAAGPATKCARCGTVCPCKKVCKLVCEEKSVEVVCWGAKCEEFCVPGPGCPTCKHCKCVCETCDEGDKPSHVSSEPKRFIWHTWRPSFPQMYTKHKLMKRIETVKVPTYKWVTEDVCCHCATGCHCVTGDCAEVIATDAPPPMPKAELAK